MISEKNILLISPEPWDHIFVSKHHYAVALGERNNKIFFLGPPSGAYKLEKTRFDQVYQLHYPGFVSGFSYLPSLLRRKMVQNMIRRLEKLISGKIDMVWSFDNSVFFDLNAFSKEVVKIHHVVDLNQDFQLARAARSADICFGVIPEIVTRLQEYNRRSYLVRHGVQVFPNNPTKVSLPGENNHKAVYVGNMDMPYIDWELLEDLAISDDQVDYIFIGNMKPKPGNKSTRERVLELPNCYFTGRISHDEIPGHLAAASFLFLAYTPAYDENCASPHKLMEYLASGKPVLSTYRPEYASYQISRLFMHQDRSEFIPMKKALMGKLDLLTADFQHETKAFVAANTYSERLIEIERELQKL